MYGGLRTLTQMKGLRTFTQVGWGGLRTLTQEGGCDDPVVERMEAPCDDPVVERSWPRQPSG